MARGLPVDAGGQRGSPSLSTPRYPDDGHPTRDAAGGDQNPGHPREISKVRCVPVPVNVQAMVVVRPDRADPHAGGRPARAPNRAEGPPAHTKLVPRGPGRITFAQYNRIHSGSLVSLHQFLPQRNFSITRPGRTSLAIRHDQRGRARQSLDEITRRHERLGRNLGSEDD